jgi:hypothetical protein
MKKLFTYTFIALTTAIYSCSDFMEIKPKGQADIELFSSKQGVNSLLIGAYSVVDGVTGMGKRRDELGMGKCGI